MTHRYSMLDGELVESRSAGLPVPEGVNPPERSVFTTMKVTEGCPVFFFDHFARLESSAGLLELGSPGPPEQLRERCSALVSANGVTDCALRIVVYREADRTRQALQSRDRRIDPAKFSHGFRLATLPRDPKKEATPGHKTLDYRANLRALEEARSNGFDEVLFIDSAGEAWECAVSNIFAIKDGAVLTPPVSSGALPGIIRGRLLKTPAGVPVRESRLDLELLISADEAFVTNSLVGVMPVSAVADRRIPLHKRSVTANLAAAVEKWEWEDRSG